MAENKEAPDYLDLTRQIIECVEQINHKLESIADPQSSLELKDDLSKLVDRYIELADQLIVLDPPSSPKEIEELAELMTKMETTNRTFQQERQNLKNSKKLHKSIETILGKFRNNSYRNW